MTNKILGFSLLTLLGCGAQTHAPVSGDDDVPPDAGSGSQMPGDDGGMPPPPPLQVAIVDSTIHDERGDKVTFVDDAPVHDHAGALVTLGATGCPAVGKYAYLLDTTAPAFGREVQPNPLAWQFSVTGGAPASADFRVRTATATQLDWTPALGAAGAYSVQLYRSGAQGIAALGSTTDQFFIDFRVRDAEMRETIVTGCWEHHPLAAPLSYGHLAASADSDALAHFTLAANSPVSHLIDNGDVKVMSAEIVHGTAESVELELTLPVPTGTFTKAVVNDLIPAGQTTDSIACGNTCQPSSSGCVPEPASDPRCSQATPADPFDPVTTAALQPALWGVRVVDAGTNIPAGGCSTTDLVVHCSLQPRGPLHPTARHLIVQLFTQSHTELAPGSGTISEFTFQGLTYTGVDINVTPKKFRCDTLVTAPPTQEGELFRTCTKYTTFETLIALDSLKINFDGVPLGVKTGFANGTLAAPPTVPGGTVGGTAFVWDSGNDDLPGTQH
jgi:hypothetical protein